MDLKFKKYKTDIEEIKKHVNEINISDFNIKDEIKDTTEKDNKKEIKKEIKQDKNEVIPIKKKRFLAIILKENKDAIFKWVNSHKNYFTLDENYYFIYSEGNYISKNSVKFAVYLEGISTPLNHGYIDKQKITKTIKSKITGLDESHTIVKIKGLKFDSNLIYMLLNRKLIEKFTTEHIDVKNIISIILSIIIMIIGIINIGMWFR